jgi:hypothetical protein
LTHDLANDLISQGLSLVQADAQHDLRLGFRCRLLALFNDQTHDEGRWRRTRLATLCVEKVLPLWEVLFPEDQTPRRALDVAESVLAGGIAGPAAERALGELWTHYDDLMWRFADKQNAIMVGYAAVQAVRESLSDRHFGCENVTDESLDRDIEPHDSDSSHFASVAYSGGAAWEAASNPQRRLAFWTWWLESAVPNVLGSAPDDRAA